MLLLLSNLHFDSFVLNDEVFDGDVEPHDMAHDEALLDKVAFRRFQQTQRVAQFFIVFPYFVRL